MIGQEKALVKNDKDVVYLLEVTNRHGHPNKKYVRYYFKITFLEPSEWLYTVDLARGVNISSQLKLLLNQSLCSRIPGITADCKNVCFHLAYYLDSFTTVKLDSTRYQTYHPTHLRRIAKIR